MIDPLEGKALASTQVPDGCNLVMFDGAVRSSKTVSSLLMWMRFLIGGPRGALAIIGRTETSAINNVVLPLQEMLGAKRVVLNRGTGTVSILGREISLYGANDKQAYTKIQGRTLAGAYVDEGAVVDETFFNMLVTRLSVPGAMLFLTCNPEGSKHWLKVNWLDRAAWHLDKHGRLHDLRGWKDDGTPKHHRLWRVTFLLDDNRWLARNNPQLVADLKSSWPPGSVFHRRYILSEWVNAEGSIYPMWDETRMTFPSSHIPPLQPLMAGVDFGSVHKTRGYLVGMAWLVLGPDGWPDWEASRHQRGSHAALIVYSEHAPEGGTVGQQAAQIEGWLQAEQRHGNPSWVAVDSAARVLIDELNARGRSDVMGAFKSVVAGIETVGSLLAARRLFVAADECPWLLKMLPSYVWDRKASERGETKPVKENDDECVAFGQRVLTADGWRPIETIRPGDLVQTRAGLRPVEVSRMTSEAAQTVVVELHDGRVLRVTGNHPLFFEDGSVVRADALMTGDMLYPCQSPSLVTGSPSAATPAAPTSRPTSPADRQVSKTCTGKCGSESADRSPTGGTSTTSTTTPATTTCRTSSACRRRHTSRGTPTSDPGLRSPMSDERTSSGREQQQPRGTGAPRAAHGTPSTPEPHGPTGNRHDATATTADRATTTSAAAGSAATDASRQPGERPGSMMSTAPARSAAPGSLSAGTPRLSAAPARVLRVTAGRVEPVWNLAVEGDHEYILEGVLSHNCDALRYAVYTSRSMWRDSIPLALESRPDDDVV
jgi:hypothetical protein